MVYSAEARAVGKPGAPLSLPHRGQGGAAAFLPSELRGARLPLLQTTFSSTFVIGQRLDPKEERTARGGPSPQVGTPCQAGPRACPRAAPRSPEGPGLVFPSLGRDPFLPSPHWAKPSLGLFSSLFRDPPRTGWADVPFPTVPRVSLVLRGGPLSRDVWSDVP